MEAVLVIYFYTGVKTFHVWDKFNIGNIVSGITKVQTLSCLPSYVTFLRL